MQKHTLKPAKGSKKNVKRLGRGNASKGNYSGRGMKGQGQRSGGPKKIGFEGGQTPLYRKMPKLKGFKNINHIEYQPINVEVLNNFDDGAEITKKVLVEKRLIRNLKTPVKILGQGELTKKLKIIEIEKASKQAKEKIEKAGGTITLIAKPEPKEKKKRDKK